MAIQEQLKNDLKASMKAGNKLQVETIRMALAAIKNAQMAQVKQAYDTAVAADPDSEVIVDNTSEIGDAAVLDVLSKEVKRRREAADLYRKASRPELAESEDAEAVILEAYLPRMLSADELRPIVAAKIAEIGATGPHDMNKVMPVLTKELKGKADGRLINQVVRELLK